MNFTYEENLYMLLKLSEVTVEKRDETVHSSAKQKLTENLQQQVQQRKNTIACV
jgi:hypothetical protein